MPVGGGGGAGSSSSSAGRFLEDALLEAIVDDAFTLRFPEIDGE